MQIVWINRAGKSTFQYQSNSNTHHYECIALCKDISLQRGRFCARSLASCMPRSSKDRSSWMFFIQVVRGRPGGEGSKMAWLASTFYKRPNTIIKLPLLNEIAQKFVFCLEMERRSEVRHCFQLSSAPRMLCLVGARSRSCTWIWQSENPAIKSHRN